MGMVSWALIMAEVTIPKLPCPVSVMPDVFVNRELTGTTSTKRPKQIFVLVGIRVYELPVSSDNLKRMLIPLT